MIKPIKTLQVELAMAQDELYGFITAAYHNRGDTKQFEYWISKALDNSLKIRTELTILDESAKEEMRKAVELSKSSGFSFSLDKVVCDTLNESSDAWDEKYKPTGKPPF